MEKVRRKENNDIGEAAKQRRKQISALCKEMFLIRQTTKEEISEMKKQDGVGGKSKRKMDESFVSHLSEVW